MPINLQAPDIRELKPRITVFGVGGAGGNAVNNMIESGLQGVDFVVANTDAQALLSSKADRIIQMGMQVTQGLGAGSQPEIGRAAAEEVIDELRDHLAGAHMAFVTAGMGGGTGTGAAPVVARAARDMGILTVGVVTKPFFFEGQRRMRLAESGIRELQEAVDTLIVIPNQNLFRVANEKTTFADAFAMADQVLYSGVACITDLMVKEGLINLDFADVRAVMREMGKAMMGTGEASGEKRAITAAEAAIANPLLDEVSMKGARGLLISITGGRDMTLYEVDEAASRIRGEVDEEANIIVGATFDESLEGIVRVSVVATGIDRAQGEMPGEVSDQQRLNAFAERLRSEALTRQAGIAQRAPVAAAAPMPAPVAHVEVPAAIQPVAEPVRAAAAHVEPVDVDFHDDTIVTEVAAMEPVHAAVHAPEPDFAPRAPVFQPVAAEPIPVRAPRMPKVEELPLPAQAQILATRGGQAPAQTEPAKRMTLLQRLAAVGLGARKDEAGPVPQHVPQPVPAPVQAPAPAPSAAHAEYARRPPAPQPQPRSSQVGLDVHGRALPTARALEDEQLEIPAFLRRQAQ
jgi:cell division protein FtsZ